MKPVIFKLIGTGNAFLIILFIILNTSLSGQTCDYETLSNTYNFKISMNRISGTKEHMDSCVININIISKSDGTLIQTIQYTSPFIYPDVFNRCDFTRSYITGIKVNFPVENGNYGDFIVADFNFDNKEDFAIVNNSSLTGETNYSYYIQENNGKFEIDKFLTEEVSIFPDELDFDNKSLTIIAIAGYTGLEKTTYSYDNKNNKWNLVKQEIIKDKK